jgi:hypothetical protein
MAGHETRAVRPDTPQDRLKIAAGSSLAIQGIFLEILRERFSKQAGLEWYWDADNTTTRILIESGYNEELESRNQVPALYVTRLQSTPSKVAVGDRFGVSLPEHKESFKAVMRTDMAIECVSNDEGESSILGDVVQFTILASQDVIEREFGFYGFQHPILGQTAPYDRDQKKWSSTVNFAVEFWIHWAQVPIAPLLQQLSQNVQLKGTDVFKNTVLTSMRRGG